MFNSHLLTTANKSHVLSPFLASQLEDLFLWKYRSLRGVTEVPSANGRQGGWILCNFMLQCSLPGCPSSSVLHQPAGKPGVILFSLSLRLWSWGENLGLTHAKHMFYY